MLRAGLQSLFSPLLFPGCLLGIPSAPLPMKKLWLGVWRDKAWRTPADRLRLKNCETSHQSQKKQHAEAAAALL